MLSLPKIQAILQTIPQRTIGVLGDLFLDRYLDLDDTLTEPSIETGLPAYQVTGVRSYPGAAGTILNNLVALGVGRIVPITFIGDDGEGYEIQQALQRMPSVDRSSILLCPERRTPTYTKPMLKKPGQSAQELNRFDIKNRQPTPIAIQKTLMSHLERYWSECDVLLVLDQVSEVDCGVLSQQVREHLQCLCQRDPHKFVLADSRERIKTFRSMHIKPNWNECFGKDGLFVSEVAQNLIQSCQRTVICTKNEQGIWLFPTNQADPVVIPAYPVSGPIDPVGAGDSCSAGIACAMSSGCSLEEAAAFGNLIASITVQKIGTTGTATPEEVYYRWQQLLGDE